MTKKRIVILHVLAWVSFLSYCFVGILYFPGTTKNPLKISLLLQLSYILSLISVFYYCYSFVVPGLYNRKLRVAAALGALATPFVFTFTRYLLEEQLYKQAFGFHNYDGITNVNHYILYNLYRGLPAIILSIATWCLTYTYRQERENKLLSEEKIKAELAFLKSQLNPHLLHNTLNYIHSLAYPVSARLADAIVKLSQLMRYILNESPDTLIDLDKEIDYLENYIDIYRMRFEDNFHVAFKAEGDITGKRLASLVLIPFVENAFKHGVINDAQRPVRIQLKVIANRLMFTVSNKINRTQKDYSSGISLANIRRRLDLIYPGKHELLISENGQTYKTTLNIEL